MENSFDYKIVASSRRKTIALEIKNEQVLVRSPNWVSLDDIRQLVSDKQHWIQQKLLLQKKLFANSPKFTNGSKLLVDGELRTIRVLAWQRKHIEITDDFLTIYQKPQFVAALQQSSDKIKSEIKQWMRQQALQKLPLLTSEIANQLNLFPKTIGVRYYKSRWGSCNSRAEIQLNYLLMMCPAYVVRYVIIHELCHLKHMNHGAAFWQLVEQFCPQYQVAKQWLKQHQAYFKGV